MAGRSGRSRIPMAPGRSARLNWMGSRVADVLGGKVTGDEAAQALSEDGRAAALLAAQDSRRPMSKLFIYYQPEQSSSEESKASSDDARLLITDGQDEPLVGKGVYFIRVCDPSKQINTDKESDGDLLSGELDASLLGLLEAQLTRVYEPMLRDKADWGLADDDVASTFREEVAKFAEDVGEARRSIASGVRLKQPRDDIDWEAVRRNPQRVAKRDPELVRELETLMESWCDDIAGHLEDDKMARDAVQDEHGPRGMIELWRARMQELTSITEQLKSRPFMAVTSFMTELVQTSASSSAQASSSDHVRSSAFELLRRWKALDVAITEAANEAKDNVKYLNTLDKFIEPLYAQSPPQIVDALPALLNSIKMVYTISRYLCSDGNNHRMIDLLQRIVEKMIRRCIVHVLLAGEDAADPATPEEMGAAEAMAGKGGAASGAGSSESKTGDGAGASAAVEVKSSYGLMSEDALLDSKSAQYDLWFKQPQALLRRLRHTLRLNDAFQTSYRLIREALEATDSSRKFDWPDRVVFGRFDLFCRRAIKLIDLFSTCEQMRLLKEHKIEGMEPITEAFDSLIDEMRRKNKYELLRFTSNAFDRDFVEFNVRVTALEGQLQRFIDESFRDAADVMSSLQLLRKFEAVLQRESLRRDLASKFSLIFQTFGEELEMVRDLYDTHRHSPPVARNAPPVAGNIAWARHLLQRIEAPMRAFEANQAVLATKPAKRIVGLYNRVARVLVSYEYLWYQAWTESIPKAKAGLQATLIIRHPADKRLYVNLDQQILQLIREAKVMDRMGIEVPESARVVLLQEAKLKSYYNSLSHVLREYGRITKSVPPVCAPLLRGVLHDFELKLRPGMVSLTWTSLNIDSYKAHLLAALQRLEELVASVVDILNNRIEKNLKLIALAKMVSLPDDDVVTTDEFVSTQHETAREQAEFLRGKNLEVESAVEDLCNLVLSFPLDPHVKGPQPVDAERLRLHYSHFLYSALLNACKQSLNALKKRVAARVARAKTHEEIVKRAELPFETVGGPGTPAPEEGFLVAADRARSFAARRAAAMGEDDDEEKAKKKKEKAKRKQKQAAQGGQGLPREAAAAAAVAALTGAAVEGSEMDDAQDGAAGDGDGEVFQQGAPFFEIEVELAAPDVRLSPSLESVQQAINRCAVAVLGSSKRLRDWGNYPSSQVAAEEAAKRAAGEDDDGMGVALPGSSVVRGLFGTVGGTAVERGEALPTNADGTGTGGRTFYDRISSDLEVVRVVLLLTGSVQSLRDQVDAYLSTFRRFSWMWERDIDQTFKEFASTKPNTSEYEQELGRFLAIEAEIDALQSDFSIGALSLSTRHLKTQLKELAGQWRSKFSENLHRQARKGLEDLTEYIRKANQRLSRNTDTLPALAECMQTLRDVRTMEANIDAETAPVLDMYAMLERYHASSFMDKDELDQQTRLMPEWKKLVELADTKTAEVQEGQSRHRVKLLHDVRAMREDVRAFRQGFLQKGPMRDDVSPDEALDLLRRYSDEFEIIWTKKELYQSGERLFALPVTEYPELDRTKKELSLLNKLYGLYRDVKAKKEEWSTILWSDVVQQVEQMAADMQNFADRVRKLPGKLRTWAAYGVLEKDILDYQGVLPLLTELSKPCMRERHWKEIEELTGGEELPVNDSNFTLQQLMSRDLAKYQEDLEEICDAAARQEVIEQKLHEIEDRWAEYELLFKPYKETGIPILAGVAVVTEELEEDQGNLQTVLTARHIGPFAEWANALLKQLSDTSDTLDLWTKVLKQFVSLEPVFMKGDIARQLPKTAGRFQKLYKEISRMQANAADTGKVVKACENEALRAALPVMYQELEGCSKKLGQYLEQKRAKFPRFYFVSDPVLLQILSQGSDPHAVQPFFEKVFDAVSHVVFDKKDRTLVTQIVNVLKGSPEEIDLRRPVKAQGNIEDWLTLLLEEMQKTLKEMCEECANDIADVGDDIPRLRGFVDNACGQYSLLGLQLKWTTDMEKGLSAGRGNRATPSGMKESLEKTIAVREELTKWCRQPLGTVANRKKIETLVTIQVHQVQVANELRQLAIEQSKKGGSGAGPLSTGSFDWTKQVRFYWRPDGQDRVSLDGQLVVGCTDYQTNYSFEYLGIKERLVITPLTDRCYITLSQALRMKFGGAPAGPAGTGKTETVKDFGRTLGLYVVVTNCSSEMSYRDCAKIFKGLSMAGLWGCFDEFNRILLPVLSVVAQQLFVLQAAARSNHETFQFPGDPQVIPLNPQVGYFITMNPGYAGRQELPENLKALFRGVAMMVPDRRIIIEVKLVSVGYSKSLELSQKFFACYRLCEEQLSQQKHYDFGLRNILSVLRTAGATLRENPHKGEAELLYRTLRDMNLSKMVKDDVPLFTQMLDDLFVGIDRPETASYPDVEREIQFKACEMGLVMHKPWARKVVQLYETSIVRHGIMLSGPTGGGKTMIIEVLRGALQRKEDKKHVVVRLNPKAVKAVELYGQTSPATGEWEVGIFSSIWEKYNQRELPQITWITCDGPVDTIWIESLNTVLDDNRLLTLASGDRFPMTDNVLLLFENQDLRNASPATVSRAGIVFVSAEDLDYHPVVESWVRKQPAEYRALLRHLIAEHVGARNPGNDHKSEPGETFEFRRQFCSERIGTSRVGAVNGMLSLIDAILKEATETGALPGVGGDAATIAKENGDPIDIISAGGGVYTGEGSGHREADADKLRKLTDSMPETAIPLDDPFEKPSDFMTGANGEVGKVGVSQEFYEAMERIVLYSAAWSIGAVLEPEDRARFDALLRNKSPSNMPDAGEDGGVEEGHDEGDVPSTRGLTVFEYDLDSKTAGGGLQWVKVRPQVWEYPSAQDPLDFSNLLVPTMDSTRASRLLSLVHGSLQRPTLLVGGPGTAKTCSVQMYVQSQFDPNAHILKKINCSSATTPAMLQQQFESGLEKHGGKSFRPPGGKRMTVFIDDVSMPEINEWGDQPTNELTRQTLEDHGFYFLEKERRGEMRLLEGMAFIGAMIHPGGGRNDLPARVKRHFYIFNMVLPDQQSLDDMYGQMVRGRFTSAAGFDARALETASRLTTATIDLWRGVKAKMLPTPAKFHYVFNIRDLSRVFQGVLLTPYDVLLSGGQQMKGASPATTIVRLWRHECSRVFADKLVAKHEKYWVSQAIDRVTEAQFGAALLEEAKDEESLWANFFRDDVYDEDEVLIEEAPRMYEAGGALESIRSRAEHFMNEHNREHPSNQLNLVLFDDALKHLLRISRILQTPRGSALLVGVGGSGKQSLTRLAAFINRSELRQITLIKNYGVKDFKEDLRILYDLAGHQRKDVTFLLTDAEIKDEAFLEFVNIALLTGDIPALFAKDEMMAITADLSQAFSKAYPGLSPTADALKSYFIQLVRDNLHVVLCMSPVNPKFPERARKFPGLVSSTTIDWFLPWPEDALRSVSRGYLEDFEVEVDDPAVKDELVTHVARVHQMVVKTCDLYWTSMRRRVYQTPKSFLSFLQNYKDTYVLKLDEIKEKESRVNLGLSKLIHGAEDVATLKEVVKKEKVKVANAEREVTEMLGSLEVSSAEAEKEAAVVSKIKADSEHEAQRIRADEEQCQSDLAAAQPFLDQAVSAAESIKPKDITEIKAMKKPSDIIRVVLDTVLIYLKLPIDPVQPATLKISKKEVAFILPSFALSVSKLLSDEGFRGKLTNFDRNNMLEETIELVGPYLDFQYFTAEIAGKASNACEGLAVWSTAMRSFHRASKIVKPRLEALQIAQEKLKAALAALKEAEDRFKACEDRLAELKAKYDGAMADKTKLEEGAAALESKMIKADKLIGGLRVERKRWQQDSSKFAERKRRLIGDCAAACMFVSYCGPFNAEFRRLLIRDRCIRDCRKRGIPVSPDIDVITFLVDEATVGEWNLQGLPQDPLSKENGILVTRSSRRPLLIDPQGQALVWIKNREEKNLPRHGTTTLTHKDLKDQLTLALEEGLSLILTAVEEELDPIFDPILENRFIKKGRKTMVEVQGKLTEMRDDFKLFFITRLPNPHFSPELQAKTTVVDFTVTMQGLEDQLLGRVIGKEQRALEELLQEVLADVNENTRSLQDLNDQLLTRLTQNEGNLLDDENLLNVLNSTKQKAEGVQEQLSKASETRRNIDQQREVYRPVATRGSVLYFSIVAMSEVNPMYQTSLAQFVVLFMQSMDKADRAKLASKRVGNIIETMTYMVYRYINRGLFEQHKLLFVFTVALKILVRARKLSQEDIALFLRGGAALDMQTVSRRMPSWIKDPSHWLNAVALAEGSAQSSGFFRALIDYVYRNEASWQLWYESEAPESDAPTQQAPPPGAAAGGAAGGGRRGRGGGAAAASAAASAMVSSNRIPDYEDQIRENTDMGSFLRMVLVRSLRPDRTMLAVRRFVRDTKELGEKYVEPVTDTIEQIYTSMDNQAPVIFLLSEGADPTESIKQLAHRKKNTIEAISLGQGQEPVAQRALQAAVVNGTWVLLQNCELGLGLMDTLEEWILSVRESAHEDFRFFITAQPDPKFPLGLLQLSIKVTNMPPTGLRAGLLRSFTVTVDQDRLERIDGNEWPRLLMALCFLHSIVQERRKFGALGWCKPYEYNSGDLDASIRFLERHMYASTQLQWPEIQYQVAEVQYGGKITDDMDRRLFNTFTRGWIDKKTLEPGFTFSPANPIQPILDANGQPFRPSAVLEKDVEGYRKYAQAFPDIDSPELFGLHPNADLTFRNKESREFLGSMALTQPRQVGGDDAAAQADDDEGDAPEDDGTQGPQLSAFEKRVQQESKTQLQRLPPSYDLEDVRLRLSGGARGPTPLQTFLRQEIEMFNKVIVRVRDTLQNVLAAIKGEVVLTTELQQAMDAIFNAAVPRSWLYTPGGDEFSWLLSKLGGWMGSLVDRDNQLRTWLMDKEPAAYWLTGFFNPQGFMTATKQQVARAHHWALDVVEYNCSVTAVEKLEQAVGGNKDGVLVYGLSLDGAAWERAKGMKGLGPAAEGGGGGRGNSGGQQDKVQEMGFLTELPPRIQYVSLPILWVSALDKTEYKRQNKSRHLYKCPLYKYPLRMDLYLIAMIDLPYRLGGLSAQEGEDYWIKRGVALLCATEV